MVDKAVATGMAAITTVGAEADEVGAVMGADADEVTTIAAMAAAIAADECE